MVTNRTPEAHAAVLARLRQVRSAGQFVPPSLEGTVIFPGFDGGAEWGGAAFDPASGLLYVNANEMPWILRLVDSPRERTTTGSSLYNSRRCAGCHRQDRKGSPPEFPALDQIATRRMSAQIAATNTQLLWYRSDLVPEPQATWAEMIADAEQLAKEGKPHYIEIQGAQYEGATVWFNTMVSSAGGTVLNPDATKITLNAAAVKALTIMKQLATSTAADPSLTVQMENQNRLQMEAGNAAFQLNYPFVYPGMKADNPKLFKVFKWALCPLVTAGIPGQGDDRRHRPGGELVLAAQGPRLPGRAVPA